MYSFHSPHVLSCILTACYYESHLVRSATERVRGGSGNGDIPMQSSSCRTRPPRPACRTSASPRSTDALTLSAIVSILMRCVCCHQRFPFPSITSPFVDVDDCVPSVPRPRPAAPFPPPLLLSFIFYGVDVCWCDARAVTDSSAVAK